MMCSLDTSAPRVQVVVMVIRSAQLSSRRKTRHSARIQRRTAWLAQFVMDLDNQFERMYFRFNPDAAIDIYDNLFVHKSENTKLIKEKMKSTSYCVCRTISWLPFKVLTILFMLLPFFCLFMMVFGTMCK